MAGGGVGSKVKNEKYTYSQVVLGPPTGELPGNCRSEVGTLSGSSGI